MEYDRPEGCKASVKSNWKPTGGMNGDYVITADLMCGDKSTEIKDSFKRNILDINFKLDTEKMEASVAKEVSDKLGAMCLGCSNNTKTNGASVLFK